MVRSFSRSPGWVTAGTLAGWVFAGPAAAGYLDNDPNDSLDPQFNPNNYAAQLISATGPIGRTLSDTLYSSPNAVLGAPNLYYYDPGTFGPPGNNFVSIVNPPYNTSPDGNPLMTQLNNKTLSGSTTPPPGTIEVKMGSPVYADPTHPYGIDFIVYGNSFFGAQGGSTLTNSTNLNAATLTGLNGHITSVSVSPDGVNWYTYPDTQALLPYNGYLWDSANATWSSTPADQLKPVNPGVYSLLPGVTANSPAALNAADATSLYGGAAGGTGFSLQGTGFSSIQYIRVTAGNQASLPNSTYTLINAFAATRSMVVGDDLTIAPDNITAGTNTLYFQNPGNLSQTMIAANFATVSDVCTFSTALFNNPAQLAPINGPVLGAYQFNVAKTLPTAGSPTYTAEVKLLATGYLGNTYQGNGSDLSVQSWNGSAWMSVAFTYDPTTHLIDLPDWSQLSSTLVVNQKALPGDANLDGRITLDDYLAIDAGYRFGGIDWAQGDFNGDGVVNYLDYALIDYNFGQENPGLDAQMETLHTAEFGSEYVSALDALGGFVATVPEPASLSVVAFGGLVLLRRRRGCGRKFV